MRSFLLHLGLFLAVQAVLAAALWSRYPLPQNAMFAAARDKQARLHQTAPPRLIFVGGSNLAFGLDSVRLEATLGRPVVNMGLHAGLRLGLMTRQVAAELRPGDVVVVAPEYEQFTSFPDVLPIFQLLEQAPEQLRYCTASDWFTLGNTGQLYLAHVTQLSARRVFLGEHKQPQPPYTHDSFNPWGDVVAHLDLPTALGPLPPRWGIDWRPRDVHRAIDRLNDLAAVATAHQAQVFLAFPQFPGPLAATRAADLARLDQQLRKELHLTVLNHPADMWLPPDVFYDTPYHLLRAGRDQRTTRLIDVLRAAGVGTLVSPAVAPGSAP